MGEASNMNRAEIEAKWQKTIWSTMAVVCACAFVFSLVLQLWYRVDENLGTGEYVLKYVILPAFFQVIMLLGSRFHIYAESADNKYKNYIVVLMIFVVLGIMAFAYYTLWPVVIIPCVAIVATALFADQVLTVFTGIAVFVLLIVNMTRRHVTGVIVQSFGDWFLNLFVLSLFVILLCVMVVIINKHTNVLMQSITGSYNRQVTLMSELITDPMTGLYNRRTFEDSLEKEIMSVETTGEKSYIAIFDIDHFKNVNDTYGHSNGDIVIKALCKMMKDKSKDKGTAFRYGGEEFVILFHGIELPKVMNIVEDIRTEFRCYYFNFMYKDGITCSCGIAEYIKGESSKAWFNRADAALYNAKENGRNRTVISE